jgi:hypothetical protein
MNWRRPLSNSSSTPALGVSSSAVSANGSVSDLNVTLLPPAPQQDGARGSIAARHISKTSDTTGSVWSFNGSLRLDQQCGSQCHASNASQANDDDFDIEKMNKWNSTGTKMVTDSLTPGWSMGGSLLQHGEAMIREQEDMQQKKKLYQIIALEGRASPMRQHLAKKIQTRLREEEVHKVQTAMEVQQSCMSIKKHINGMSNARKNLNTLRIETQHTLQPLRQPACMSGLCLHAFFKTAEQDIHEEDED